MPTVQFVCQVRKINRSINMPAPIKVQQLWKGWYRQAKSRIPDIPDVPELVGHFATEWLVEKEPTIDVKWIRFDLVNRETGERAQLVIDRKGPSF